MSETNYLVPDRECGSCTACCKDLAINADGVIKMNKLPGVPCQYLSEGTGCSVYAQRPSVCQTYYCLWRSLDAVGDEWRPDRSGILMHLSRIPPNLEGQFGVDIILIGAPEVVVSDHFASLIGGFIESGTATYLNYQPGPGLFQHQILLNDILRPAITERHLAKVKELILRCYEHLKERPTVPITGADTVFSQNGIQ